MQLSKRSVTAAALLIALTACDEEDGDANGATTDASTSMHGPMLDTDRVADASVSTSSSNPTTTTTAFGGAEECDAPKPELLIKLDGSTDDAVLVGTTLFISTSKGLISLDVVTKAQQVIHPNPYFGELCTLKGNRVFVDHVGTTPMDVPYGNPEIIGGKLVDANLYAESMVEAGSEILLFDDIDFDGDLRSYDGRTAQTVATYGSRIVNAAASDSHYFAVVDPYDAKPSVQQTAKQRGAANTTLVSSPEKEEIGMEIAAVGQNVFFTYDTGLAQPSTLALVPVGGGSPKRLAGPLNAPFFYSHGDTLYVHAARLGGAGGTCLYKWNDAAQRLNAVAADPCGAVCNAVLTDDARKQLYLVGSSAVYRIAIE